MKPWELLDAVKVPGGVPDLKLYRRGREFVIRAAGTELMNSLVHGSEDALADLAAEALDRPRAAVLIGGLGMGYTLAAALKAFGPRSRVTVAELVGAVIAWNRGPLAHLAGRPLDDPRVAVVEKNVAFLLQTELEAYDAILLDVDNGPEGLVSADNDWIYSEAGLEAARTALRPGGVLGVWSAGRSRPFLKRMRRAGFTTAEKEVRARKHKGAHNTIWIGVRN